MPGAVCLLQSWDANFLQIWFTLSGLSLITLVMFSGISFYYLYGKPTYEIWQYKINAQYPSTEKVKEEIIVMLQGLVFSTICPALSLYLSRIGLAKGYCGVEPFGYDWLFISFLIVWLFSDFYEFFYHWCGHYFASMWTMHKGHHAFYNPTPFAVIADSPIDQFFRAAPLLFFPMLMPVNMDMIFTLYSVVFYFNGLIQHSGHELKAIDGHNKYILTSYHHYLHHARSTVHHPFYNGQLFQVWDNFFSSTYSGPCLCSKCCREKGERSLELWKKTIKPDYSVLMNISFWMSSSTSTYSASGSQKAM